MRKNIDEEKGGPSTIDKIVSGRAMTQLRLALAPRIRELKFDLYLMSKSMTSIIGLSLLIILVIVALFPNWFAAPSGADPLQMPLNLAYREPLPPGTAGYLLGSGENGADYYYGIIWGAQTSMKFAIIVVGISVVIGMILGLIAGYKGGIVDEVIMRITDVFLSIPSLILVMAIAAVLVRNLQSTQLALIAVWWSGYTRLIRGQVLSVRENVYVDAARAAGTNEARIMMFHVLPNSWQPMVVQATMDMGTVVLVLAGLSYLGLGAPHGYSEWGSMIQSGQSYLVFGKWWMIVFPGIAIVLFVLAFNLLGDGLRDILDPRMRR